MEEDSVEFHPKVVTPVFSDHATSRQKARKYVSGGMQVMLGATIRLDLRSIALVMCWDSGIRLQGTKQHLRSRRLFCPVFAA